MPRTTIYGPQTWPDAFSYSAYYQSSAAGGSDTPNADYPELASAENAHMVVGAGPSGENVADAIDTTDYTVAGVALTNLGPLTSGQYDARGLNVEWKHKLKSSGLNEAGVGQLLVLTNGGSPGTDPGLGGSFNPFLILSAQQTSGNNFDWNINYRHFVGSGPSDGTSMSTPLLPGAGLADNGYHTFRLALTPSTVTGSFTSGGVLGSAVVASDGAIAFYMDGVLVSNSTGLNFVINARATSNPEVYYGVGLWHGYSDMLGPHTGTTLYYGTSETARNLLTGSTHTVQGSDNLIVGSGGTVTGDRNALFALCDDVSPSHHEIVGDRTFKVCADTIELVADTFLLNANGVELAQMYRESFEFNDTQIKAWPSSALSLTAAPGSGLIIVPHMVVLLAKFASGAYTNINAAATVFINLGSQTWSNYIGNDAGATPAISYTSTFAGAVNRRWVFREWTDMTDPSAGWGSLVAPIDFQANQGLTLVFSNGGSGNLTGGNAANRLQVTVYYSLQAVP